MKLITFRPKKEEADVFEKALSDLDVTPSDLARESFREGFFIAVKKIADRKKQEAAAQLKKIEKMERAKGFEPSTFTLAR